MADTTEIAWTDSTWSPWEGCTKVSPACDHCYAARMNGWLKKGQNWGPGAPRLEYGDAHWEKPLRWNEKAAKTGARRLVFPSVCDPFDNEARPELRARFFELIEATPHLTWLLLTKRIGNAWKMMADAVGVSQASPRLPLPNVWLGATICSQTEADRDIPKLLRVPARVRFLSLEPLLGPVDLVPYIHCDVGNAIDWVICGGESGPQARPMHPDWVRSVRDQCAAAGVPWLFKQWGQWAPHQPRVGADLGGQMRKGTAVLMHADGNPPGFFRAGDAFVERVGTKAAGRLLDGRTHDEFPRVRHG